MSGGGVYVRGGRGGEAKQGRKMRKDEPLAWETS